jgi:hypothetical protein
VKVSETLVARPKVRFAEREEAEVPMWIVSVAVVPETEPVP